MAGRESPLDIAYSLRIGTSIYHVLGKRRKGRKTQYDYYVMEDKFIRSKSNRKSSRPRYIVDEPNEKKKPPRKRTALDAKEMKKILDEVMDAEREKIVASLRAAVAEENQAAYEANRDKDRTSTDLIKRTVREALNIQKESLASIEEKFVQTIGQEIQKDKDKSRKEEDKRMKELFAEQNQALIDTLNQNQQKTTAASLERIKTVIAETIQAQKEQDKPVSHQDLQNLEAKLIEIIHQMAPKYKSIKLFDDINLHVSSSDLPEPTTKKQYKTKDNMEHTGNRSSIKQKQPSIHSTEEQSPESHNRDKHPELDNQDD